MTQERTPVSPEEAAEADTREVFARHSPEVAAKIAELGARMKTDIEALAAAREAGRREGMEESARASEQFAPPASVDPERKHVAWKIAGAIRAKLEGK